MTTENTSEMMNLEPSEMAASTAIELSEDDLDSVSGGLGINFGDVNSFAQQSGNFFSEKSLSIGQATFAGPNGSGTISQIDSHSIDSGAFQNIAIG